MVLRTSERLLSIYLSGIVVVRMGEISQQSERQCQNRDVLTVRDMEVFNPGDRVAVQMDYNRYKRLGTLVRDKGGGVFLVKLDGDMKERECDYLSLRKE